MNVDWITVSAQIVNFLILVGLLKHFLYRPVLEAMDRREARIAARLGEAETREQEAEAQAKRYRTEAEQLDRRREALLTEAGKAAEQEKRRLLEQARAEVAEARSSWRRQLEHEQEAFLADLRRESAGAIQTAARKALADLADAELEHRIVRTFLERLRSLDEDTRQTLAAGGGPVRVTSGFPLSPEDRTQLGSAIGEQLAAGREVVFERSAALLCGLELESGGLRVSWTLKAWLDELAGRVAASLDDTGAAGEGA